MKKIKLLSLLMALLLSSSLLLASCGDKKDKETESESETEPVVEEAELTKYGIADIMNASYAPTPDKGVLSAIGAPLSYVGNYVTHSNGFVITDDGDNVRVYNAATDAAVGTFAYEKGEDAGLGNYSYKLNYVDVISDEFFAVLNMSYVYYGLDYTVSSYWGSFPSVNYFEDFYATEYNDGEYERVPFCTYTITVYDAAGTVVDTYSNTEICSLSQERPDYIRELWMGSYDVEGLREEYKGCRFYVEDLYTKGSEVYRKSYVDGKAKYELVKDFGTAAIPDIKAKSGDYYLSSFSAFGSNGIQVYKKDLTLAYSYSIPSDAELSFGGGMLADGTLVVQYSKQLDQHETDYDIRMGKDGKYDIVTLLVNADGVKEAKDVDYVFYGFESSLPDMYGNKMYSDKVENLARVAFIGEDKTIDMNAGNTKLMLLSNDLEITAEVEGSEDYSSVPYTVAKGYYAVYLVSGGYAVYNDKGEKIAVLDGDVLSGVGEYVVSDNSIYLDGALVYDGDKEGTYVSVKGNMIYVTSYGNGTETYSIFVGKDNMVKIGTKVLDPTIDAKTVEGRIASYDFREECAMTKTLGEGDAKDKYVFYNAKGEVIATLEEKGNGSYNAFCVCVEEDYAVFAESYYADGKEVTTYYKSAFAK